MVRFRVILIFSDVLFFFFISRKNPSINLKKINPRKVKIPGNNDRIPDLEIGKKEKKKSKEGKN